jgi:uncharacterized flavoprotein (TIGR03862 family)
MDLGKKIIIIGGGPAGLFSAYHLLKNGFSVDLYDQSSGLAKKFLIAGNGGLNLTHSEDLDTFSNRYGKDSSLFKELLNGFSPNDLREWCLELGIETFVGSSGRIFPMKLKSAEILANWIKSLNSYDNFNLYLKHRLIKITPQKEVTFQTAEEEKKIKADTLILAMGGASWKQTGSDGLWKELLTSLDIKCNQFLPMNCGFERPWSEFFIKAIDRAPLKNLKISFKDISVRGEVMLTPFGIEGGGIYALSNLLRDEIIKHKTATVSLDLKPELSSLEIIEKLEKKKNKISLSNHLRKTLGINKSQFILLKELLLPEDFQNNKVLASKLKDLQLELSSPRPIDEAISTSGGVCFSELNKNLELNKISGIYIAGEMLDFEAPTGGYLLQGCFSSGWTVVQKILSEK